MFSPFLFLEKKNLDKEIHKDILSDFNFYWHLLVNLNFLSIMLVLF